MSLAQPCESATEAWKHLLQVIIGRGKPSSPRGMETIEVLHNSVEFPMHRPAIYCPPRVPSYKFMAAEAIWITDGSNRLDDIRPYNKAMQKFSDDDIVMAGAYGPPFVDQAWWCAKQLLADKDSRQAVMTIWRPRPAPSKDIPCTVAMTFNVRQGMMNSHVFMRSSDGWLGVPYDFFSFSMMAAHVACLVNAQKPGLIQGLGRMHWTAVSSHLYAKDVPKVEACIKDESNDPIAALPRQPIVDGDWDKIRHDLEVARDGNHAVEWSKM